MSKDQKKSLVTRLREDWHYALIVAVIGGFIALIIAQVFDQPLRDIWNEYIAMPLKEQDAKSKNMSQDEALADAKETIGASVVDVIPFRNVEDTDQQYIAVIIDPSKSKSSTANQSSKDNQESKDFPSEDFEDTYCLNWSSSDHPCYSVTILQKSEGSAPAVAAHGAAHGLTAFDMFFHQGDPPDTTPDPEYRSSILGVDDIDKDGNKEVYSIYRAAPPAGTAIYWIKIKLFDPLTGEVYELQGSDEPTSPIVSFNFTNGKEPKKEFATWMRQKAEEFNLFNQRNDPYSQEVQEWIKKNGKDFDKGKPEIDEHNGRPPIEDSQASCSVDDGAFEWLSYTKGALFSYDKAKDTHYIVWVPKSNYDWVGDMISGKKYLWFDVIKDDGLLVFNKETQTLEVVPIPELKGWRPGTIRITSSDSERRLRSAAFSLYIEEQPFNNGAITSIPLTSPDTINATEEFKNAATCKPNSYRD